MTQQTHDEQVFQGRTIPEVMKKVTTAFGRDAIIVAKRHIKGKTGLLKLGSETLVEIVARPPTPDATHGTPPSGAGSAPPPKRPSGAFLARAYAASGSPPPDAAHPTPADTAPLPPPSPHDIPMWSVDEPADGAPHGGRGDTAHLPHGRVPDRGGASASAQGGAVHGGGMGGGSTQAAPGIEDLRADIRRLMAAQARGGLPAVGEGLLDTYYNLLDADVTPAIARELVQDLQHELPPSATLDPEKIRQALIGRVTRMIPVEGAIRIREGKGAPTVAVLVGPTGVGKTTTLVKVAFDFTINHKKRVAIITEDVKRPGAEVQLRNVTQLLNLPLMTADTPRRVVEEIHQLRARGVDLILIDTAGRVPGDREGMEELDAFLRAVVPDETHLVLPCNTSERSAAHILDRFGAVGYDRILLSKLDEAFTYGLILNLTKAAAAGFSYCTAGQEYAKTLHEAHADALATLIAGGARVGLQGEGLILPAEGGETCPDA